MQAMDPKLRATLEVGASAFLGGALTYLEPVFNGGTLPPQAQWGHVLVMALATGIIATYHALRPSPTSPAPATKSATVTERVK